MKGLFVDTAGWMMLADAKDPLHKRAQNQRDEWLEQGARLLTTDYVMDETLTLLRVRLGLEAAEHWWNQVSTSPRLSWCWIDALRAERARGWFFRWRDKGFSFTDCTSFCVMREYHLTSALTSDHHFRQAGFLTVPSST